MENKNYSEERFDSFLNKTIIFSSKDFFRRQAVNNRREQTIVNDENYATYLENLYSNEVNYNVENNLQLHIALESLSDIEQSVIFLLFQQEFSQEEAAKILEICAKSVSRIKIRAIGKLKKYFEGGIENEK